MRKIVGDKTQGGDRAFTIIEVVVVVGIFLVMVAILGPFVRMVKVRANRINCANNLMQISVGLHRYAADHNDAFPQNLGELYPNYVEDERAFDCPASKIKGTKDKPDYNYVTGLTESSPLKEMIVQDLDGNHKKTGKNILRINGSVEWVSARR
jgi:type II secretory pathway pseudopilin PulG